MLQDDCAITPVISESSANFIEGLVKDAEQKGATLCQKYKRENNLIWPVLIDHVNAVSPLFLTTPQQSYPRKSCSVLVLQDQTKACWVPCMLQTSQSFGCI